MKNDHFPHQMVEKVRGEGVYIAHPWKAFFSEANQIVRHKCPFCLSVMITILSSLVFAGSAQPRHHRNVATIPRPIAQYIHNSHKRDAHHWIGNVL